MTPSVAPTNDGSDAPSGMGASDGLSGTGTSASDGPLGISDGSDGSSGMGNGNDGPSGTGGAARVRAFF